jgi:hypothetical protein
MTKKNQNINPYEPPKALKECNGDRWQIPDLFFQECFAWFVLIAAIFYSLDIFVQLARKVSE